MLYIHIPYCLHKCTYCAFYSQPQRQVPEAYVEALCRELQLRSTEAKHPLRTLYVGGGTPSLLSPHQWKQIINCLRQHYDFSQLTEATIECNPETLTPQYLESIAAQGIFNRLSIGVQSFHNEELHLLNRAHDRTRALQALQDAYRMGFHNLSMDLIYGLPGQSVDAWQQNLQLTATLPISHLSCYALTVEPGTLLDKQIQTGRVSPTEEETALQQYHLLLQWAKKQGFHQYEISNFCREGYEAVHNSRYWNRTPYIGVGAGAHSFSGTTRRWNLPDTTLYIQQLLNTVPHPTYYEEEKLTERDAYNETVMLGLRTTQGICKATIAAPYRAHLQHTIAPFLQSHMVEETATHYRPTAQGLLQADGISATLFLPAEENV